MKVRIRFQKHGDMRFVGHLDLMRFFTKAIRRADLPIAYSKGFHPHPVLSFAQPLGVGLESDGEYMDADFEEKVPEEEIVSRLNGQMAEGMHVTDAVYLGEKAKKAMALVTAARYRVRPARPALEPAAAKEALERFYTEAEVIPITKKTKKSERTIDLKPLIYDFIVNEDEEGIFFDLFLSAGSGENIKPDLVMEHFFLNMGIEDFFLSTKRIDLYGTENDTFVPLGELTE